MKLIYESTQGRIINFTIGGIPKEFRERTGQDKSFMLTIIDQSKTLRVFFLNSNNRQFEKFEIECYGMRLDQIMISKIGGRIFFVEKDQIELKELCFNICLISKWKTKFINSVKKIIGQLTKDSESFKLKTNYVKKNNLQNVIEEEEYIYSTKFENFKLLVDKTFYSTQKWISLIKENIEKHELISLVNFERENGFFTKRFSQQIYIYNIKDDIFDLLVIINSKVLLFMVSFYLHTEFKIIKEIKEEEEKIIEIFFPAKEELSYDLVIVYQSGISIYLKLETNEENQYNGKFFIHFLNFIPNFVFENSLADIHENVVVMKHFENNILTFEELLKPDHVSEIGNGFAFILQDQEEHKMKLVKIYHANNFLYLQGQAESRVCEEISIYSDFIDTEDVEEIIGFDFKPNNKLNRRMSLLHNSGNFQRSQLEILYNSKLEIFYEKSINDECFLLMKIFDVLFPYLEIKNGFISSLSQKYIFKEESIFNISGQEKVYAEFQLQHDQMKQSFADIDEIIKFINEYGLKEFFYSFLDVLIEPGKKRLIVFNDLLSLSDKYGTCWDFQTWKNLYKIKKKLNKVFIMWDESSKISYWKFIFMFLMEQFKRTAYSYSIFEESIFLILARRLNKMFNK